MKRKTHAIFVIIVALAFVWPAIAQDGNSGKKPKDPPVETFDGMAITADTSAGARQLGGRLFLDYSTGQKILELKLKIVPVNLENATGLIYFSEKSSPLTGQGLIPFSDLTANQIELLIARIHAFQAENKEKR